MKLKPKLVQVFFIGCAVGSITACRPAYYAPNSHNVPLFREKNEIHVSATTIGTINSLGFEGNAAYSFSNHFGILINGAHLSGESESITLNGKGYMGEFGVGYFKPLGENFIFETFIGGGLGRVSNANHTDFILNLNFQKYFLQPTIGFSTTIGDIAFSPKIALIRYNQPFTAYYRPDYKGNFPENLSPRRNYMAFEPALTMRTGWKYVKFQFQISQSYQKIPLAEETSVSMGLHLMLAPRFKNN